MSVTAEQIHAIAKLTLEEILAMLSDNEGAKFRLARGVAMATQMEAELDVKTDVELADEIETTMWAKIPITDPTSVMLDNIMSRLRRAKGGRIAEPTGSGENI